MRIGSTISKIATPIAGLFNMPCVDPVTGSLRPDSPCARVRDDLDAGRWRDAFWDFIWRKPEQPIEGVTTEMKEWIIIHQLGVQANSYLEAIQRIGEAETLAITVQLRQMAPQLTPPIQKGTPMVQNADGSYSPRPQPAPPVPK